MHKAITEFRKQRIPEWRTLYVKWNTLGILLDTLKTYKTSNFPLFFNLNFRYGF